MTPLPRHQPAPASAAHPTRRPPRTGRRRPARPGAHGQPPPRPRRPAHPHRPDHPREADTGVADDRARRIRRTAGDPARHRHHGRRRSLHPRPRPDRRPRPTRLDRLGQRRRRRADGDLPRPGNPRPPPYRSTRRPGRRRSWSRSRCCPSPPRSPKPNHRCGAGPSRPCHPWRSSPWSRSSCPPHPAAPAPAPRTRTNPRRDWSTTRPGHRDPEPAAAEPVAAGCPGSTARLRPVGGAAAAGCRPIRTGPTSSGSSDDRSDPARPRTRRRRPRCSSAGVAGGPDALPRSVDVLKDIAAEYGVCVRPLALRRTDLDHRPDRGHRPALRRHPGSQVPAVRQAGPAAAASRRSGRAGTATTNPYPAPATGHRRNSRR